MYDESDVTFILGQRRHRNNGAGSPVLLTENLGGFTQPVLCRSKNKKSVSSEGVPIACLRNINKRDKCQVYGSELRTNHGGVARQHDVFGDCLDAQGSVCMSTSVPSTFRCVRIVVPPLRLHLRGL